MIIGRAVSTSVWKVDPSPPRSRKSWKSTSLSRWPNRLSSCFLSRAVSTLVATQKALKNFFKAAPSPCWSGKSRRLHLGLESLETAKFGRAGHPDSWAAGSRRIWLGRKSRALVFQARTSGNGNFWSRESGHTNSESRCFVCAASASVAIVATDHHGRNRLEMPSFGRQFWTRLFFFQSLDMPKFCREMSLGPRPGIKLM